MTGPTREFWVVEFNHPTYGWSMIGYPMYSHVLAQAEIVHKLCDVPKKKRDAAVAAYRIVKYVPEAT